MEDRARFSKESLVANANQDLEEIIAKPVVDFKYYNNIIVA